MHISTIVFVVLLIFFTWRGYEKGFIKSITRILSWILAYPAAIFFTKPVANLLMQHTPLDGVLVYFIAGSCIFLAVATSVTLLLNLLAKHLPENHSLTIGSKLGGASVGVLMGSLLGLIVVYVLGILVSAKQPSMNYASAENSNLTLTQEARNSDTGDSSTNDPDAVSQVNIPQIKDLEKSNDRYIEATAKKLMGKAASAAINLAVEDKTTANITQAFVEDPQSMLTHIQEVNNKGQLQNLMADEKIQSILTTGDTDALLREPGFQELMHDANVQALLTKSNIANEDGAEAAAQKMVQAWSRVQTLKHDPRVIAILNDPEFQQQLNSTNKLQLMMNPKLNQLTEIIFTADTSAPNTMTNYKVKDISNGNQIPADLDDSEMNTYDQKEGQAEDAKNSKEIYRWTDEKGQVHYSDKPLK